MAIVSASGGVDYVVRATLKTFYRARVVALLILMVLILVPGALTGAGSVSLLVVGAPVSLALLGLGVPRKRVAAILFIVAGLSAAAPPVNIWAMMLCAGTAIPYVGFELPLGIPVILLGTFTVLVLGGKREGTPKPRRSPRRTARRSRNGCAFGGSSFRSSSSSAWSRPTGSGRSRRRFSVWPSSSSISAAVAVLVSPVRPNILTLSRNTVRRLLPLLSSLVIVGMLQQVMTATGVRGLLSYAVISIPLALLFVLLPVIIPFSEGVLTYGGAAIIGIPLIWYLDSLGYHATVVIAGLSLLWPWGTGSRRRPSSAA